MKIALSIPGTDGQPMKIDSGLSGIVPTGGLDKGLNIIWALLILIVVFGILIALWHVLKGGVDIIMSRGIKEKFQSGRDRVVYALLGLGIIFLAFFAINIISSVLGYNLLPFKFIK